MLQAVLSNHTAIATRSEPWLQLLQAPFINPDLMRAPFDWKIAVDAANEVEPEGRCLKDVQSALRSAIDQFYEQSTEQSHADYFLDKTPRYYYMLNELYTMYPDALFLVLLRHPASVFASIYKTWLCEKPESALYDYAGDLIDAPRLMRDFITVNGDSKRVLTVEYEELTQNPNAAFADIFSWLGLDFSEDMLSYGDNSSYIGKYGDPVGVQRGKVVARQPIKGKKYSDIIPDRRLANLASGLTDYCKDQGYPCPGGDEWQGSKPTKEFKRFLRMHQLRNKKQFSLRDGVHLILDNVSERLGL